MAIFSTKSDRARATRYVIYKVATIFVLYTHIRIVSDWLLLQFPDLPITAQDLLKSSSSSLSKCDFEVSNITLNPIVLKVPLFMPTFKGSKM